MPCLMQFFFSKEMVRILFLCLFTWMILSQYEKFTLIQSFVYKLHRVFPLKDLSNLNYFLGNEVVSSPTSLFVTQHKYLTSLIDHVELFDSKPVSTLMVLGGQLSKSDVICFDNALAIQYRNLVGVLQYCCITRLEFALSIG